MTIRSAYLLISLLLCSCVAQREFVSLSGLRSADFNTNIDGRCAHLYRLVNRGGMEVCITDYGARIVSVMAPDANGHFGDVVCGFDNVNDYHRYRQNFGATVGRYIGRILNGQFMIDSTTYKLQTNGGKHCSHGGYPGFADRQWRMKRVSRHQLCLTYLSPDGENGFPGNLNTIITFTLGDDNTLRISYKANTDKPTVLNLSNHSFFNISDSLCKDIEDEVLWIDADSIAEYDNSKCVTGRLLAVKNTPFDFTQGHDIRSHIDDDDTQIRVVHGYDHTWRINSPGDLSHPIARIIDRSSGRMLEVFTTEPGIHIYTANGLNGKLTGKSHIAYRSRSAICFETMHFADSPNKPQFPSTLLLPGHTYHSTTIFKFGLSPSSQHFTPLH